MEITIVKKDTYRSEGRKINQSDDKVRLVIDMDKWYFNTFKKILLDNSVSIKYLNDSDMIERR